MNISGTKKGILMLLVTIEIFTVFLMFKSLNNKNSELPKVEILKKTENIFAIMIPNQNNNGYIEYEDTSSGTKKGWPPSDEYTYSRAECLDSNGSLVDNALIFDKSSMAAILETNQSLSCTLFFDKIDSKIE